MLQVTEANPVGSTQAQHLTVQCGFLSSRLHQKHLELPNYVSCYQNIAKLLPCPIIYFGGQNVQVMLCYQIWYLY